MVRTKTLRLTRNIMTNANKNHVQVYDVTTHVTESLSTAKSRANANKYKSQKDSIENHQENRQVNLQYDMGDDSDLVVTHLVSEIEYNAADVQRGLKELCQVELSVRSKKDAGKYYCSKKTRVYLARCFFQSETISDARWTWLRKMMIGYLGFLRDKTISFVVNKKKHKYFTEREFDTILSVALYIKLKYSGRFPYLAQHTLLKFDAWRKIELPSITKIKCYYPSFTTSDFVKEVNQLTPWFEDDFKSSVYRDHTKKMHEVDYKTLQKLIAKSFNGYNPSPQYIGQLGYDCPQTRTYTLSDFKQIRAAIIESNKRRGKPDNFIIIESL